MFPITSLLAAEGVQAASAQSVRAAEQLDLALRRAFFGRAAPLLRHEVLAAADTCPDLDVDALTEALDDGRFRGSVMADFRAAHTEGIPCSGTVVLPDGTAVCNPGTRTGWIGGSMPKGTPVLLDDDPSAYDRMVKEALAVPAG